MRQHFGQVDAGLCAMELHVRKVYKCMLRETVPTRCTDIMYDDGEPRHDGFGTMQLIQGALWNAQRLPEDGSELL